MVAGAVARCVKSSLADPHPPEPAQRVRQHESLRGCGRGARDGDAPLARTESSSARLGIGTRAMRPIAAGFALARPVPEDQPGRPAEEPDPGTAGCAYL